MRKLLTFLIALAAVAFAVVSPASAQGFNGGGFNVGNGPFASGGGYTAQGVLLSSTTQLKANGPQLTGIADSKVGTISFWIKTVTSDSANPSIFSQQFGSGGIFDVVRLASGLIRIQMQNSAVTNIFLGTNNTNTFYNADGWKHFLASWDLSTTTMQMTAKVKCCW